MGPVAITVMASFRLSLGNERLEISQDMGTVELFKNSTLLSNRYR